MTRRVVDPLLPTTMVGSYPRPQWYTYQLHGRDIWDAFKVRPHHEAFVDCVRALLKDQENAGLDIVTDGQVWFDDYGGAIGSFVWYWYERIPGFSAVKHVRPNVVKGGGSDYDIERWTEWGGSAVTGPVERGPLHLADLFRIAQRNTQKPVKMSVGAGAINLGYHVYLDYCKSIKDLAYALAPIFNSELKELVAAGCQFIQYEDLGAWLPINTGNKDDAKWVVDVVNRIVDGVDAKIAWHFCYGNNSGSAATHAWGANQGYAAALPYLQDANVHQFVLDFALRKMADIDALQHLAADKEVAVGVIDVRTTQIETPEIVADRIRKVVEVVPEERVYLTTDCGMRHLPRFNAYSKLKAMAHGAQIVRRELAGESAGMPTV
ncbi:MAG: hypothetical protein HY329_25100 [Chloroflexi bacterium]|nr:hypothetical protein [Chloroflexota bacterium]